MVYPTMEMGYDKITSLSGIETVWNMFFLNQCGFFFNATDFQRKPSVLPSLWFSWLVYIQDQLLAGLLTMDHQRLGRWVICVVV